jgi:hypothetical protein
MVRVRVRVSDWLVVMVRVRVRVSDWLVVMVRVRVRVSDWLVGGAGAWWVIRRAVDRNWTSL